MAVSLNSAPQTCFRREATCLKRAAGDNYVSGMSITDQKCGGPNTK